MKSINEIKKNPKVFKEQKVLGSPCYFIKNGTTPMIAIFSNHAGWEHVSVSLPNENRCPTWEEMCKVKDIFFNDEEVVLQIHPKKSEYVDLHPYCLHLWKSTENEFISPPKELVF